MTLTTGSLCTGYAGLDLAIEAVFGAKMAWLSELEPAACIILEQHFPDVPNLGDLTVIDWTQVEPVDILSAGYPCQPFSHAGNRKGSEDERHLWPFIADAVRVLRPRWVVLENVAGHLSLGLGSVLGDLAELGYDTQWRCVRASDVGAPHGRKRIFILATDTARADDRRVSSGVGSGQSEAAARDGSRAAADTGGRSLAGAGAAGQRLSEPSKRGARSAADAMRSRPGPGPDTGSTQSERARFVSGRRSASAADTDDKPGPGHVEPTGFGGAGSGPADQSVADTDSGTAVGQLPRGIRAGRSAASVDVRRNMRDDDERRRADDAAADTDSAGSETRLDTGRDSSELRKQSVGLASTAADTESVSHGQRRRTRGMASAESRSSGPDGHTTRTGVDGGREVDRQGHTAVSGRERADVVEWGPYRPAVERWERIIGRAAPDPTIRDVGRRSGPRLNPRFVEWMMGLPAGWVTDSGIARNPQLKALGNGVVPQQAAAALRYLLTVEATR